MKGDHIIYKKGYKYQLQEAYSLQLDFAPAEDITTDYFQFLKNGTLTVMKKYAWDGPSGPTWDTLDSMRGSLVHDVGYQMIREGYLLESHRPLFDLILHQICVEDGMSLFRAKYWYLGVKHFAIWAASPAHEPKPIIAP
jgi:hypothetical protein